MRLHPSLSAFGSKDKALLIYEQTDNEPRRQSHAAHPQTNLILQYDDWQVKKTFLELLRPNACLQALHIV